MEPIAQAFMSDLQRDESSGIANAQALVGFYVHVQKLRVAARNRARALEKEGRPSETSHAIADELARVEQAIAAALAAWVRRHPAGQWALRQHGVGPILAAALLALLLNKPVPERASSWWAYAGLAPDRALKKGQVRSWNATLKVFCYRLANSFVRFHADPACYYGQVYAQRRAYEEQRNAAGAYRELAERALATRDIRDPETRSWYEKGMLPPGRIDLRARRYAVKLFLAHLHDVCYETEYGRRPPNPYPIPPPQWEGVS